MEKINFERCEICRGTGVAPNYNALKYQFHVGIDRRCMPCNGKGGVPTHRLNLDAWVQNNRKLTDSGPASYACTGWVREYMPHHLVPQMLCVRVWP